MEKKTIGRRLLASLVFCILLISQTIYAAETYADYTIQNQEVSFQTIDGGTVSTKAEGTEKVIIFYRPGCGYCQYTISKLAQSDWLSATDAEIIAADVEIPVSSLETIQNFKNAYAPDTDRIKFAYGSGINSVMWNYLYAADKADTVTTPVTVFINKNNEVKHITTGYLEPEEIAGFVNRMKEDTDKIESTRLAGNTRYDTAIACAEQLREGGTFSSVILASADNFPDALTGCTLAAEKNAPILLVGNSEEGTATSLNYVANYVQKTGKIYLLGGTSAVSAQVESKLGEMGYSNIKRLDGATRYETNLKIVNEMSITAGTDVVIASGAGYADSLSISGIAGANGMPIFLAGDTLPDVAIAKIQEIAPAHIYIIGGNAAVNSTVENQAKNICAQTQRIYGEDRYLTSIAVANYFGMASSDSAVVAYGGNFPDGLTGGVLAAKKNAPVILVSGENYQNQIGFIENGNITKLYIMGGTAVISDEVVSNITRN